MKYDFAAIEKKWQDKWRRSDHAVTGDPRPKFYGLIEFPYPSAAGLHVGHPRPFTAMDIICREKRMQGYNVLNPIGFDAFGLPTENFAIKNHIHPPSSRSRTSRTSPASSRCSATASTGTVWWTPPTPITTSGRSGSSCRCSSMTWPTRPPCPSTGARAARCVLANEEVVEGDCERCGSEVIRKEKSQWMLRITKYADRLIDDLDDVDFIRARSRPSSATGSAAPPVRRSTFTTNTEDDMLPSIPPVRIRSSA